MPHSLPVFRAPAGALPLLVALSLCALAVESASQSVTQPVAGAPDKVPVWEVDPQPLFRLPATDAEGRARFGTATWATRLGDDEVVLADGADNVVRIFGLDGRERRTFGREGRGPGEFRSMGWIGTCGTDSLFVWDIMSSAMRVLHATAGYARSISRPDLMGPMRVACSSGQEFAFPARRRRGPHTRPVVNTATPEGVRYRIYLDTSDVQTIGATGADVRAVDGGLRRESVSGNLPGDRFASMERPLGLETHFAFTGDQIALAYTDSGWVRVIGRGGAPETRFRIVVPARRMGSEEREAGVVALLRRTPGSAIASFGELGRAIPVPERAPAVYALLGAPDGLLWFVVSPPDARETRLVGYRPDGTAVAFLAIPAAVTLFEVGREHLLGRTESDDGDQELVLYLYRRR